MIKEKDRVRHIDAEIFKLKGIMTVLEVKNGIVVCYIGDPYLGNLQDFRIEELLNL